MDNPIMPRKLRAPRVRLIDVWETNDRRLLYMPDMEDSHLESALRQMLESVKLKAKELGVKALLHCIEIDTCRSSKFVPAGYKKYRFDFVGRTNNSV